MRCRARSAMAIVCVELDPGELASPFFLLASAYHVLEVGLHAGEMLPPLVPFSLNVVAATTSPSPPQYLARGWASLAVSPLLS
jgi:hypothetical protein